MKKLNVKLNLIFCCLISVIIIFTAIFIAITPLLKTVLVPYLEMVLMPYFIISGIYYFLLRSNISHPKNTIASTIGLVSSLIVSYGWQFCYFYAFLTAFPKGEAILTLLISSYFAIIFGVMTFVVTWSVIVIALFFYMFFMTKKLIPIWQVCLAFIIIGLLLFIFLG